MKCNIWNIKKVFAFMLLLLVTNPSPAAVRRICKVQYNTSYGLAGNYRMEVEFVTGYELNNMTKTFSYTMYDKYALIWFAQGEVAIIRLNTYVISNNEFDHDAFQNMFLLSDHVDGSQINTKNGEDQEWRISAKEYLAWIDPRER